jgi:hypothetical protein
MEAHHLVDTVALLWRKTIESFGKHTGILLKECIRVLLQVFDPLLTLLEGRQFPEGYGAGFLEYCELGS